jgi:hypothetical protein
MGYHFYVYAFLRPDGTPYYVGKGSGDRAYRNRHRSVKAPRHKGLIVFLRVGLAESVAFQWEMNYIRFWGRKDTGTGMLRNRTDGGEGPSGHVKSPETRAKLALAGRGRILTAEERAKIAAAATGRVPSAETRTKIGAAHKGKTVSGESRAKLSEALKRRIVSAKTREKISAAHKGRAVSAETREKISAARKGKKLSAKHRAKIAAAGLGRTRSPESVAKSAAAHKGIKRSDETRARISAKARARSGIDREAVWPLVLAMLQAGHTYKEAGAAFGISGATVCRWRRDQGITQAKP